MNRVFVTPEISSDFRRLLTSLSIFSKSEITVASEKIGKNWPINDVIVEIVQLNPDLIITTNEKISEVSLKILGCRKVVLLTKCSNTCQSVFWSNALNLNAFILSNSSVFEM